VATVDFKAGEYAEAKRLREEQEMRLAAEAARAAAEEALVVAEKERAAAAKQLVEDQKRLAAAAAARAEETRLMLMAGAVAVLALGVCMVRPSSQRYVSLCWRPSGTREQLPR